MRRAPLCAPGFLDRATWGSELLYQGGAGLLPGPWGSSWKPLSWSPGPGREGEEALGRDNWALVAWEHTRWVAPLSESCLDFYQKPHPQHWGLIFLSVASHGAALGGVLLKTALYSCKYKGSPWPGSQVPSRTWASLALPNQMGCSNWQAGSLLPAPFPVLELACLCTGRPSCSHTLC